MEYNKKEYNIIFELHDISNKPNVNDIVLMHKELLEEKFLSLGSLDSKYGRKIESNEDKDIVVFVVNNKNIILKRLYG